MFRHSAGVSEFHLTSSLERTVRYRGTTCLVWGRFLFSCLLWIAGQGLTPLHGATRRLERIQVVRDADGNRVLERSTYVDAESGARSVEEERRFLIDPSHPSGFTQVAASRSTDPSIEAHLLGLHPIGQVRWNALEQVEVNEFLFDGRSSVRATMESAPTVPVGGTLQQTPNRDAFGTQLDEEVPISAGASAQDSFTVERGFRGEWFSRELGLVDLRARGYAPDSGRFTSADAFEGEIEDPSTLHRFAYASNDPINRADPTGFVTLLELDLVQKVQSNIRSIEAQTPRAALDAARIKTWEIYWGIRVQPSRSAPVHAVLFAQNLLTQEGIRYEVGILGPKPWFDSAVGGIRRRPATLAAFQKYSSWNIQVARLNLLQFIGWDRAIGFMDADESVIPMDYSVFGFAVIGRGPSNCVAWSLEAAMAAWAASKVGN